MTRIDRSRREFLIRSAAAGGLALAPDFASGQALSPTPECTDGDEPTIRQTEGPYFKPRSPERSDMREPGQKGRVIELSGLVLTKSCRPVARALVDLWHADDAGDYDEKGFRCRGHQFTDASGRYVFRTIVPAVYPGRARHFHVKVQAPRQSVLTTQLYFPGEAGNAKDFLFKKSLLMRASDSDPMRARFDFVLNVT